MEIVGVDPIILEINHGSETLVIPAGTMGVIPHKPDREDDREDMPDFTIICAGQDLERKEYPKLGSEIREGDFYNFRLPNLVKKFIIGINAETNEILWGDGIIYYEDFPKPVEYPRDIRQTL